MSDRNNLTNTSFGILEVQIKDLRVAFYRYNLFCTVSASPEVQIYRRVGMPYMWLWYASPALGRAILRMACVHPHYRPDWSGMHTVSVKPAAYAFLFFLSQE